MRVSLPPGKFVRLPVSDAADLSHLKMAATVDQPEISEVNRRMNGE